MCDCSHVGVPMLSILGKNSEKVTQKAAELLFLHMKLFQFGKGSHATVSAPNKGVDTPGTSEHLNC